MATHVYCARGVWCVYSTEMGCHDERPVRAGWWDTNHPLYTSSDLTAWYDHGRTRRRPRLLPNETARQQHRRCVTPHRMWTNYYTNKQIIIVHNFQIRKQSGNDGMGEGDWMLLLDDLLSMIYMPATIDRYRGSYCTRSSYSDGSWWHAMSHTRR